MSHKFLSAVTFVDGLAQSVTFSNINGDDLPPIAFSSLSDVNVAGVVKASILYFDDSDNKWHYLPPYAFGSAVLKITGIGQLPSWQSDVLPGDIAYTDAANTFVVGPQTIIPEADATKGLVVKAHSATQTGNYVEAEDSSGNARIFMSPGVVITGKDANYIALKPGTREYRIGTSDSSGQMIFGRSDNSNGLAVQADSSTLKFTPVASGGNFNFVAAGASYFIFCTNEGGGSAPVQFGRRESDSSTGVGASVEFWPQSGQTTPACSSVAPGGGTGGASPVKYRFFVDIEGDIYCKYESSTTNARTRFSIVSTWATSTDASRKARVVMSVYDTAARTAIQLDTDGSGATATVYGSRTNDSGAAGTFGEYIEGVLASGSATGLTTATAKNVTSISLTAGDWDVTGVVDYVLTAATATDFKSGSSSTSATFGGQDSSVNMPLIVTLLSDTYGQMIPVQRFSLASTTTVYLVAQATFSAGTVDAYGTIRARRVR